ncbi:DUF3800 domain-containing protein [Geomicrobium sp. JCM 19039]|uniref:DUF3800 domain-containing protein n=1 Tax=Geomicrobium sp. JCM 19039 TaxID=1460636 RepID=UPI00045F1206|nr:DUF3800 domain-containing protein [Geomicrobium sp. JCM 19039]GAK12202.1 putative phage protein [Geomicrobium sp. JCM 19039]
MRSTHIDEVRNALDLYRYQNNLNSEMKWSKVSASYLEKYKGLMDIFMNFVIEDKVKMRVMFLQNEFSDHLVTKYAKEQLEDSYFKLYYQFIKHAFGLKYSSIDEPINARFFFDQFPDKKEKVDEFREFIYNLQFSSEFQDACLRIRYDQIVEADSKDHTILQCADIVTGAMNGKLNGDFLKIPPGKSRRGKRTIAKEKLYKHISSYIREWKPNFNVGMSTGNGNALENKMEPSLSTLELQTCPQKHLQTF